MPKVSPEIITKLNAFVAALDAEFQEWRSHYIDVARFVFPRRNKWLSNSTSMLKASASSAALATSGNKSRSDPRNSVILDSTGTEALRNLANGLHSGITPPARPWFELRLSTFPEEYDEYPLETRKWLETCAERMHTVFAESNFYGAMATLYVELSAFGTAVIIIYEDFDDVIRCYTSPTGEFRLYQDDRRMVQGFARSFILSVENTVAQFGLENCSKEVQAKFKAGGESLLHDVVICHLIRQNNPKIEPNIKGPFSHVELYWETQATDGSLLRLDGYKEKPLAAVRWEISGHETYGTSPTMDALPDIKQLQIDVKQKAIAKDKMIRPPIVADVSLRDNPNSLLPGGISWITNTSGFGAKPIFTVNPPVGEMMQDIANTQTHIKRLMFNNLFRNVSELDTVRSATEIAARQAEDMVMLGPVLERFEQEGLSVCVMRLFNIMLRKNLFPKPPPGVNPENLKIRYVSILAEAQRSIGTGAYERFLQLIGQLGPAAPEILTIPNFENIVRNYAGLLNLRSDNLRSREEVQQAKEAEQEQLALQQAALVGKDLTAAGQNLASTEIGGGSSALDALLGG